MHDRVISICRDFREFYQTKEPGAWLYDNRCLRLFLEMKVVAPAYYNRFACISSACRHSCCVGWEVDIDADTLALYDTIDSPLGDKIRASIERDCVPHFRLGEGERCPHLCESGLCNIIIECGESALSQICRDHPRYRNYYDGVVEVGLGLSCEEATRIAISADVGFLVSDSEDMTDAVHFDEYPAEIFSEDDFPLVEEKRRLLKFSADKGVSVEKKLSTLLPDIPTIDEIKELFLSLEILDEEWKTRIEAVSAEDFCLDLEEISDYIENILTAMIYRHLNTESFYAPSVIAAFAALSARVVVALSPNAEDVLDTLRAYSAEIEYSVENTERVFDFLEEFI